MANVKDLKVNEPTQRLRGTLPKIGRASCRERVFSSV